MGGVIVLEMAMEHPERVSALIVGCSGILGYEKPRMPKWMRMLYHPAQLDAESDAARACGDQAYGSAADPARIAEDKARLDKDKHDNTGDPGASDRQFPEYSTTKEAVAKLTIPVLVLHGDEDALVPIAWGKELADTVPNARFVAFKGAGHNYMIAGGDKANDAVLEFVASVDQRA